VANSVSYEYSKTAIRALLLTLIYFSCNLGLFLVTILCMDCYFTGAKEKWHPILYSLLGMSVQALIGLRNLELRRYNFETGDSVFVIICGVSILQGTCLFWLSIPEDKRERFLSFKRSKSEESNGRFWAFKKKDRGHPDIATFHH